MMDILGKLENVDLRKIWQHEATDFTPWLAQEENIALLGNAIGMELEVEGTEQSVGPFNADILCKDTIDNHWVLVENQLEKTDHGHFGQLLTYAAGLQAVTIVWIAKHFTDEHRAALDWLNEITDETFNFFGLEIELWKIGDSKIAPHFKFASKPNGWTKSIGRAASKVQMGNLTEAKKLQLDYWTQFREYLLSNSSILRPQKALPQHWTNYAIGRSNFHMSASVNTRDGVIAVQLSLTGDDAKPHFYLLQEQRHHIENAIDERLDWQEKPDKKESWIYLSRKADPWDRSEWISQHQWLKDKLEAYHTVFAPIIRTLDAAEYVEN